MMRKPVMDKIFYNGTIRTLDDNNTIVEAAAIKDGKIAFLGSNAEAEGFAYARHGQLQLVCRIQHTFA